RGAELPLQLGCEPFQPRVHLEGGAARSQRIVLVCERHAEHPHDRVADELLDRTPVTLERVAHLREIHAHELLERLRIHTLPPRPAGPTTWKTTSVASRRRPEAGPASEAVQKPQ